MLLRNDTGHTHTVHAPDGVAAVHHGEVMDYPHELFGWTQVDDGDPVVVVPPPEPVDAPAVPQPDPVDPPAAPQPDPVDQPSGDPAPDTTTSARVRRGREARP